MIDTKISINAKIKVIKPPVGHPGYLALNTGTAVCMKQNFDITSQWI